MTNYSRKDLEAIIAEHFGIPATDPRVATVYADMVFDTGRYSDDPTEHFDLMMNTPGIIATDIIADGVRQWLAGRTLS
ncbi:hypothetical protein [Pseudarthrobacter sp. BIM B-2242]|uniref:hypothetical protein n=1 Tax=Pseudarthrobacter sp. BIM B-2242 TaxID=2772401 RepID=UPI00168A487E|nr:hypothetical protein [Pseudarthrobacter sp. BIM B-2242]QOD05857.1 hypothetical protein IDT60_22980 [Pseudarthrobacter sp. BIM B-2242]